MAGIIDRTTEKHTAFCNPNHVSSACLSDDKKILTVVFNSGATHNYSFDNKDLAIGFAHNLISECEEILHNG